MYYKCKHLSWQTGWRERKKKSSHCKKRLERYGKILACGVKIFFFYKRQYDGEFVYRKKTKSKDNDLSKYFL